MNRKILKSALGIVLGLCLFVGLSGVAQAQEFTLQAKRGQNFSNLGSKTLNSRDGSVRVVLTGLEFDAGVFTLTGTWAGIGFTTTTVIDNPLGRMSFEIDLIREEFPCLDLHHEVATLEVAPGYTGELVVLGAALTVESNTDSCHLTNKVASVQLEQR